MIFPIAPLIAANIAVAQMNRARILGQEPIARIERTAEVERPEDREKRKKKKPWGR